MAAGSVVATAVPAGATPRPPVVLVLVPASRWATAPRELDRWARANLALHSASQGGVTVDSYLTIGKGRRSSGLGARHGIGAVSTEAAGLRLDEWTSFERHDEHLRYGGHLGALGDDLERADVRFAVVTTTIAAAATAADRSGFIRNFTRGGPAEVSKALESGARVVIAESSLAGVPAMVAATGTACTLVASGSSPPDAIHLGVFAASPTCGFGSHRLVGPSTRQPGFVTLTDIAPTVLSLAGISVPAGFDGGPVRAAGRTTRRNLVDEDIRARASQASSQPFVWMLLAVAAATLVAVALDRFGRALGALQLAMVPSTILLMALPWWRWGTVAGLLLCGAIAGALAVAATLATRRRRWLLLPLLAAVAAVVIGADAAHRGTLQLDSPLANNAIGAGRFAGMGNIPYGFFVAATLVIAIIGLGRWGSRAWVWVAGALAAALVVDGAPFLGADVGGTLAAGPAFAYLLLAWRRRPRLRLLASAAVAGVVAFAAFAAYDMSRPAARRTHLARTLLGGNLRNTAVRRELASVRSFHTSSFGLLVIVAAVGLRLVAPQLPRTPTMLAGAGAIVIAALLGTVLNDSGVSVAGAVAFVVLPAAILLEASFVRPGGSERPSSPPRTGNASL